MRTVAVVEAKSQFSALLSLTATIGGIGVCLLFPSEGVNEGSELFRPTTRQLSRSVQLPRISCRSLPS